MIQTIAETPRTTARNALGYRFDPVPCWVAGLIRERHLKPVDELVLKHLLRFRKRAKDSCWASKATIAAEVGCSTRTVQRAYERLGRHGLIEQKPTATPDPDDSRNRTGWRIVFLWMAPEGYQPGPGPDRPGKAVTRPAGETGLSPTRDTSPETQMSSRGRTAVSPKLAGASDCPDGTELDGKTTTEAWAGRRRQISPTTGTDDPGKKGEATGMLSLKAAVVFPGDAEAPAKAAAAVKVHGPQRVDQALNAAAKARKKNRADGRPEPEWGYVARALAVMKSERLPFDRLTALSYVVTPLPTRSPTIDDRIRMQKDAHTVGLPPWMKLRSRMRRWRRPDWTLRGLGAPSTQGWRGRR